MKLNLRRTKRKFVRGPAACGNCSDGKHNKCRPRLDGQLCTCSCPRATQVRSDIEVEQMFRERTGLSTEVPEMLRSFASYRNVQTPFYDPPKSEHDSNIQAIQP